MTEERNQLAGDIAGYFANPNPAPTLPNAPHPNAPMAEREAYLAALKENEISGILAKDAGSVTREERDRVHAEIMRVLRGEK